MHRLFVLLAGCGRLGFDDARTTSDATVPPPIDARPCAPSGHDEDGDAIDDACDVCPHIAGSQADADGDAVGDACDPEPMIARQQIVIFDPFTTLDPAWSNVGGAISNDALVLDAIGAGKQVIRPYTPTTDTFQIGMTTGNAGAGQYNFAIVTSPVNPPGGFYCEMFDDGGAFTTTMFTWTVDNTNYMHAGVSDWANGSHFANGSGTFSYTLTPTTATCGTIWQGVPRGGSAARPAIAVEELHLYAENVIVRISYFIQIRTN